METFAAVLQAALKDGERLRPRAVVDEFARCLDNETRLLREAALRAGFAAILQTRRSW